jgi:succinoglycan biosynthesis transport protein ExoP
MHTVNRAGEDRVGLPRNPPVPLRATLSQQHYGLSDTVGIFKRYRLIVLAAMLAGIVMSVMASLWLTPIYTATSAIVFDRNDTRPYEAVVEAQKQERDRSTMETELDVIRSRVFIGVVVDALKLTDNAFYNTYLPKPPRTAQSWIEQPIVFLKRALTGPRRVPTAVSLVAQRDRAISTLLSTFAVDRKGESLALSIRVNHESPREAALIADAIAQHYVTWTSSLKEFATKQTVTYLRKQADDLAKSIAQKEREIAAFTAQSDLTFDPKDDLLRARMEQLNEQFTLARVDEAGAWAKVKEARARLEQSGQAGVGRVFTSDLLTNLRVEEARLERLRGQLRTKYGENHPLVVDASSELSANRRMISDEAGRILQELENSGQIATIRVKKFEDEVAQLQARMRGRNLAEIRRRELERDLLSEQKRYDTVVLRLGILNPEEEEVKATAMVSSFAEVPVEPSFPQPVFILIAGIIGSALLSVMLVLIVNSLDDKIYTPEHTEEITERPNLISVPDYRGIWTPTFEFFGTMLRDPDSAYFRSIRTLCLAWRTVDTSSSCKVVMFGSIGPGEGKTTLALSMATMAKSNGMRAVVVDMDRSTRSAGAICGVKRSELLGEMPSERAEQNILENVVVIAPAYPYLDFVPSTMAVRDYDRLFAWLRNKYDIVVVDSLATSTSEDAFWVSSHVDAIFMVVRAGRTGERNLTDAIQRLDPDNTLLIGSIMNFMGKPRRRASPMGRV